MKKLTDSRAMVNRFLVQDVEEALKQLGADEQKALMDAKKLEPTAKERAALKALETAMDGVEGAGLVFADSYYSRREFSHYADPSTWKRKGLDKVLKGISANFAKKRKEINGTLRKAQMELIAGSDAEVRKVVADFAEALKKIVEG